MIQIKLKFGGLFKRRASKFLDAKNGKGILEVGSALSVADALDKLGIPEREDEVLIIVNDEIIPPNERHQLMLDDGDQLTLMPPIQGG